MALGSDNQAIHSLKGRVKLKKTWYFLIERVILSVATMLVSHWYSYYYSICGSCSIGTA